MLPLLFSIPVLLQTAPPVGGAPGGRILHLDDAVQTAIKAQPLVHEARAQTAVAIGQAEQARSGLLPQVSASALYERAHSSGSSSTTTPGSTSGGSGTPTNPGTGVGVIAPSSASTHDLFSFGVQGNQLLYDFNQTPDRFRAANRNVDSFRANEHTTELQVLLAVRRAFFTARADKSLVLVADETLRNEEKHVVQVKGFVAAGTQPEIALATELTRLANDRVALITAQNNYEIAKAQLNQSMGIVGDTNYDVAEEGIAVIQGEDGPDDRLVEAALKTRPELLAYQKAREADRLTVSSLKGGYGPSLSALGNLGTTGFSLDGLSPYWAVGAQIIWPFFQGGLTTGQVRTAEANYDFVSAELEAEALQIRFDVQQAVLTLRAAKASIDAANEALVNGREQLRLAEGRYQAGVGSIIELGDAQVTATNAAAQVVQADFNLSTARAQLLTALGRP